jgi:hypothetical protein
MINNVVKMNKIVKTVKSVVGSLNLGTLRGGQRGEAVWGRGREGVRGGEFCGTEKFPN